MPKQIPDDIKLRAVALLRARTPAAAVVRALWNEFEFRISRPTVQQLAEWNGIELKGRGRPEGIPNPKPKTSPHRQLALDLHHQGLNLREIREQLGISRARIHQFISDSE